MALIGLQMIERIYIGPNEDRACRRIHSDATWLSALYRSVYLYIYIHIYTCIYIYVLVTPPTTRTPLKNTVNTDTNAVFSESNF